MAQAKRLSFNHDAKRLCGAVDIFRALVSLRRHLSPDDNEPPLPDNILDHLPFYLDVHIEKGRGLIRFVKDDGVATYEACWLLRDALARAS